MTERLHEGGVADEDPRPRILTIPNLITALRLACLPVFCWLLLGEQRLTEAGLLLGGLGATDWLDGFLARKLGQSTQFGAVFDPVADRLLFFVSVIACAVGGYIPIWFCALVLAREFLVSAGTLYLAYRRVTWLGVNAYGKAGSFGLMFAVPLLILGASELAGARGIRLAGWVTGVLFLAVAWYGAYLYLEPARAALKASDAGDSTRSS